jgi:hypothetical protein
MITAVFNQQLPTITHEQPGFHDLRAEACPKPTSGVASVYPKTDVLTSLVFNRL